MADFPQGFSLIEYMRGKKELIEKALNHYLPPATERPDSLHKAMRHSIFAGGKRIRPIIAMAVAELLGVKEEDIIPTACALEMTHTALLILDDLPCMDDATMRRHKPCCHKVYGEDIAILASIGLIFKAFEICDDIEVSREIAKYLGSRGVTGGQAVDLENMNKKAATETLNYIHSHKTGALFVAVIKSVCRKAKAREEEEKALTEYAENLGLLFQIKDDILDFESTPEELGKDTRKDEKKNTFVSHYGIEKSRELMKECLWRCIKSLQYFKGDAEILAEIARFVVDRRN
ncbi:MAG: polyprenyl synthetase family protein [Candidatus Woesearchaeota archaeon]|nr:polyprenyl synthetase family protein [Candidatus Woesearchaeota archaeon]